MSVKMRTLYVAVDESGRASGGDCYSVAGCWYVSERQQPCNILTPTKDKLIDILYGGSSGISELKGAATSPETLADGLSYLRNAIYDDTTIIQSSPPWPMSFPLGVTVTSLHPELCAEIISSYVGRLDSPPVIKGVALNTILIPLFHRSQIDLRGIDRVSVLLDATTWKSAVADLRSAIDFDALPVDSMDFDIRDSKSTPGIQLADLAAYSWRRNLKRGDCNTATGILHDFRFAR